MTFVNCAEGTLETYIPSVDKPWNRQRALHLYRRIQLGGNLNQINNALSKTPNQVVDDIVDAAKDLPLTPAPDWAQWQQSDYTDFNNQISEQFLQWAQTWLVNLKKNGLKDRMSFFWHNHFVTRQESYGFPSWMYQYQSLLEKHAVGNFKTFVYEIGLTPAMLIYLNGIQNTRFDINENYARELYELFTLGVNNGYTQQDVSETAKALTGWNSIDINNLGGPITFNNSFHDPSQKTIFGKTGAWAYEDVINLLFEERGVAISEHICGKLYRHFINPVQDDQIITDLAEILRANDWELAPVLKQLFKSEHFFEEANIGTIIPGHIEYMFTFLSEIGYEDDDELLLLIGLGAQDIGQAIFNPTDVAGWPGNRSWINSPNFFFRQEVITNIMAYYYEKNGMTIEELRLFAKQLVGSNINDEKEICKAIIDHLTPKGFQTDPEYDDALVTFKGEIPDNYFTDGTWNLDWEYAPAQVFYLINHVSSWPEYQLK